MRQGASRPVGIWSRGSRRLRAVASAVAWTMAVSVGSLVVLAAPASADSLSLTKTVDHSVVDQNGTATYSLNYKCSSNTNPCVNAKIADHIPDQFDIVGAADPDTSTPGTTTVSGNDVTVTFTKNGNQLAAGATGTVTVTVKPKAGLAPGSYDTENTATFTADGLPDVISTPPVQVTINIATAYHVTATKTWGASVSGQTGKDELAGSTATKTVTIGATNTSNTGVDDLALTDPATPDAASSAGTAFDALDLVGIQSVTWPAGATGLTVQAYGGSASLGSQAFTKPGYGLPAGVTASDVTGLKFTFTGTAGAIAPSQGGSVVLGTTQRATLRSDPGTAVADSTDLPVANTVQASIPSQPGATAQATDTFTIKAVKLTPNGSKSISPATIPQTGTDATVTLTGKNSSNIGVRSLTIDDPTDDASGTSTSSFFDAGHLALAGLGADGQGASGIVWPQGAATADVTLHTAGGDRTGHFTSASTAWTLGQFPGLASWSDVTGLSVTFTAAAGDSIPVGASAAVPYRVTPRSGIATGAYENCATTTVATTVSSQTSAPSCRTLTVVAPTVDATVTKVLTQDRVSTTAGSTTTAVLTGTAHVSATTGNTEPTRLVLQDPATLPASGGDAQWWSVFQATGATNVPVAQDDTLTVQYTTDGTNWTAAGAPFTASGSAQLYTLPGGSLPAGTTGVRFVVDRPTGFSDGATVSANLTFAVRSGLDAATVTTFTSGVRNCAAVTASLAGYPGSTSTKTTASCPQATGVVTQGAGSALEKAMSGLLVEGSNSSVTGTLTWDTQGKGDLDSVQVTDSTVDGAGNPATDATSFWNAFDIASVGAITSGPARSGSTAWDPYLVFDKVTGVDYYDKATSAWKPLAAADYATSGTCPRQGDGSYLGCFPGATLNATERANAWAVRLNYAPRTDRAAVVAALQAQGDWRLAIIPTGSGVAAVPTDDPSREVKVTATLRDVLRSDGTTPVNDARTYNGSGPGKVVNGGSVHAVEAATPVILADDATNLAGNRTVTITPSSLKVTTAKTWTRAGGTGLVGDRTDLAIPPAPATPQADYPRADLAVTATNNGAKVDTLAITEPETLSGTASDPFSAFDVTSLAVQMPAGATRADVYLNTGSGLQPTPYYYVSGADQNLPTAAELADVVQVKVVFTPAPLGFIPSGAGATLTLGTQLRATNRVSGDAPAPTGATPISNTAQSEVSSPFVCTASAGTEQVDPCTRQPATDDDSAALTLSDPSIDVATLKTITSDRSPDPQAPSVLRDLGATTTLTADLKVQNVGNSDARTLTLVDSAINPDDLTGSGDGSTFFNAVDLTGGTLVGLPGAETGGTTTVQVDVLTGTSFGSVAGVLQATGGTWTAGAPAALAPGAALPLPAGITWADVQGVRITFANAAGFTTPGAVGEVTLASRLRTALRSGGQPSATPLGGATVAADALANPGESAVGRVSDTVLAQGTGTVTASPVRASADHFTVDSGSTAVQVEKARHDLPGNPNLNPGDVVPFDLTVTNTGTADLTDPVVTDRLPADADGNLLYLDTTSTSLTAGVGTSPWSVTAPAGFPAARDLAYDAAGHTVAVSWPAGTVLAPGQTVTVTLPLKARNTAIGSLTNTFGVTSTRPLTPATCSGIGGAPSAFDGATAECQGTLPLTVLKTGALTSNLDVLGLGGDNAGVTNTADPAQQCATDADGYVKTPCVAKVPAGGTMQWRAEVTAGNVAATSVTMIDVLPVPGDVGEGTGVERYSTWRPTWDGTTPTLAEGLYPPGTQLHVFYSTVADPALDYGTTPTTVWSTTAPSDPATVTGFRFVLDFSGVSGNALPAGQTVRVVWPMKAPASINGAPDTDLSPATVESAGGLNAWNTFGYQSTALLGAELKTYNAQPMKAGVQFPESVSVGDFVWEDANGNGIQDLGEPGIPGVTVTVTGPGGPVTGIDGNPVGPATTDASGAYRFDGLPVLPAGQHYTVHVDNGQDALKPYLPTTAGQGGDPAKDSSTASAASGDLVANGDSDTTLDFGFVKPVSVGDLVWVDSNHDGVQGSGEPGIPGVTLTLTGPGGPVTDLHGNPVGPTTTDASGHYSFGDLPVLPAGEHYTVHVDNGQDALKSYLPTLAGQGGDPAKDSSTGSADSAWLASGASDTTLDFGFYEPASLGDYVWVDRNQNGTQDDGADAGVNGVKVTLTDEDGTVVGTTTTADHAGRPGWYEFDGLTPGVAYTVTFTLPNGYTFTRRGTTPAAGNDSNADGQGKAWPVTLASGEHNGTIDAGLIQHAHLSVVKRHRGQLEVGKNGEYALTVTNDGPTDDWTPVTVTDVLPDSLQYVSSSAEDAVDSGHGRGPVTTRVSGQRVTFTLPQGLARGASTTVVLTVKVGASAYPEVDNTGTVSSPGVDPDPETATSTDTAPVAPAAAAPSAAASSAPASSTPAAPEAAGIDTGEGAGAGGTDPWLIGLGVLLLLAAAGGSVEAWRRRRGQGPSHRAR